LSPRFVVRVVIPLVVAIDIGVGVGVLVHSNAVPKPVVSVLGDQRGTRSVLDFAESPERVPLILVVFTVVGEVAVPVVGQRELVSA
jgi:hypothetical protein